MLEDAYAQPQRVVDRAHPLGVALGQVVVHGDHVDALALQRVQIHRQGRDQGLALARLHLRYLALVQDDPAQHLDVERTQPDASLGRLPHHRESLRQDLIERLARAQSFLELVCLGPQLVVGQARGLFRQLVHLFDQGTELAHLPLVIVAAEGSLDSSYDHIAYLSAHLDTNANMGIVSMITGLPQAMGQAQPWPPASSSRRTESRPTGRCGCGGSPRPAAGPPRAPSCSAAASQGRGGSCPSPPVP